MNDQNFPDAVLTGKRIGIFGKGGAGKSTLAILLAKTLKAHGYPVVILDADSTNLGLFRALGIQQPPAALMDYFGGMIFQGGRVTCPVDDPTPLEDAELDLAELPELYYECSEDGIKLLTAGKIGDKGPGAGCDGPVSKIARDLRILEDNQLPITIIDFKAGFEDSARGAITSLDWALVVIDPTVAAIEMALSLRDMVDQIQKRVKPSTAHLDDPELVTWANQIFYDSNIKGVLFVVNRVQNDYIEEQLLERLSDKGIQPLGVIHEDQAISIAWLGGTVVGTESSLSEIEKLVVGLEEAEMNIGD